MARVAAGLVAASLLLCLAASAAMGSGAPRQRLSVTERNSRLQAPELRRLLASLVTLTVRNNAQGEHGLLLLRLKRLLTRKQIVAALDANNRNSFEALGAIQVVPRGARGRGRSSSRRAGTQSSTGA